MNHAGSKTCWTTCKKKESAGCLKQNYQVAFSQEKVVRENVNQLLTTNTSKPSKSVLRTPICVAGDNWFRIHQSMSKLMKNLSKDMTFLYVISYIDDIFICSKPRDGQLKGKKYQNVIIE